MKDGARQMQSRNKKHFERKRKNNLGSGCICYSKTPEETSLFLHDPGIPNYHQLLAKVETFVCWDMVRRVCNIPKILQLWRCLLCTASSALGKTQFFRHGYGQRMSAQVKVQDLQGIGQAYSLTSTHLLDYVKVNKLRVFDLGTRAFIEWVFLRLVIPQHISHCTKLTMSLFAEAPPITNLHPSPLVGHTIAHPTLELLLKLTPQQDPTALSIGNKCCKEILSTS